MPCLRHPLLTRFFVPQVQLLVTSDEHENYKKIKKSLDQLRLLVEKSELWVWKGRSASQDVSTRDSRRADSITSTGSVDAAMPVVSLSSLVGDGSFVTFPIKGLRTDAFVMNFRSWFSLL